MIRKLFFAAILLLSSILLWSHTSTKSLLAESLVIAQSPFMNEFPVDVSPLNLVAADAGDVWFTAPDSNIIGRLVVTSTTDFTVQKYTVPTSASQPYDLAYRDGIIWFTEKAANRIGKLTISTGGIEEFVIPTANSKPTGIAIAKDGSVWFAGSGSNKLGKFNPANKTFQEYLYGTANAQFEDVAIESDGDVWLSSPSLSRAVFFSVSRNQFFIVPTGVDSKPIGIAVDSRGDLWIDIQKPSSVGRYAPGTLALWRWFNTPTPDSAPSGLTSFKIGSLVAIVYAEQNANQVGLLTLNSNSVATTHLDANLPTANGMPWGVAADTQGNIWIAASGTNLIARWNAPYFNSTYLPVVAR